MEALLHRLLRPARRSRQRVAALVVVALVGWLGVSAGHLHLPGEAAAHAAVGFGAHGPAHLHGFGHAQAHGPGAAHDCNGDHGHGGGDLRIALDDLGASAPGAGTSDRAADDDGHGGHPERPHPCAICLSLERGAGPQAPPTLAVAAPPAPSHRTDGTRFAPESAAPAPYRSRAPPLA